MLIGTINSVPGHFVEFVEVPVNGPTFYFARCECAWETPRDGTDLEVVEAAARRHLQAAERPAQD